MKKSIFLVFFLFMFLSLFSFASVSAVCTDTDQGIDDYNTKGTASGLDTGGNNVEKTDYCDSTYMLYEFGCQDGLVKYKYNYCSNGCSNGACKTSSGTQTSSNATHSSSSSGSCADTDQGIDDYNTKGTASGLDTGGNNVEKTDYCDSTHRLYEFGCQDGLVKYNSYYCSNGCSNGACVSDSTICQDSDNGKDYSVKGKVTSSDKYNGGEKEDLCADDKRVFEFYCEGTKIKLDYHSCDYPKEICSEGACILNSNYTLIEAKPNITSGPVEVPNATSTEDQEGKIVEIVCSGCLRDNKCYPLGYVKSDEYCTDDGNFTSQKDEGDSCENLFECKSGVCVSGECISEGFIQKILNWFKKLFG